MPYRPLLLLLAATPRLALATEYLVDPSGKGDFTGIQDAIDAAAGGDTIWVSAGIYSGPHDFSGKDVQVRSLLGVTSTFLTDCADLACVTIDQGETSAALLEGFTLGGSHGTAMSIVGSSPTVRDCVFTGTVGTGLTAAGIAIRGGSPLLDRLTFSGNQNEDGTGGDVAILDGASVTIQDSTFDSSAAAMGGGIAVDGSSLVVTGSRFTEMEASYLGAAIYASGATVTLEDVAFDTCVLDPTAGTGGGAAAFTAGSTATLTRDSVAGGVATNGGALYVSNSDLTVEESSFEDGYADWGGAIALDRGSLVSADCTFAFNRAEHGGGAIGIEDAAWQDEASVFDGNISSADGGAVHGAWVETLLLTDTAFTDNVAAAMGGGIQMEEILAAAALSGAVFTGNLAYTGGALGFNGGPGVSLEGCVFADNAGLVRAGGALVYLTPFEERGVPVIAVADSVFDANTAAQDGGALFLDHPGQVDLARSVFTRNAADLDHGGYFGGAVYAETLGELSAANCLFHDNVAWGGGATYVYAAEVERYRNNVFTENLARESGGAVYSYGAGALDLQNNTFMANSAVLRGGHAFLWSDAGEVVNNIFEGAASGAGLWIDDEGLQIAPRYNDVHGNAGGNYGGHIDDRTGTDGNISEEPDFLAFTLDGDESDDLLMLAHGSLCVDAGDPSISDLDGSTSDMGAYGGPGTLFPDLDCDGSDVTLDCDDSDPAVYPGAPEIPYDGLDQDCDGLDLTDADGDGFAAEESGGEDCDDEDAAVNPDAEEVEDGVDNRCGPRS